MFGKMNRFLKSWGSSFRCETRSSMSGLTFVGKRSWLVYMICRLFFFLNDYKTFDIASYIFQVKFLIVLFPWYPFPLYLMHYLCVIIILVNADLYKSVFPTYSFKDLVFCLSVFIFFFCTVLSLILSS